MLPYIILTFHVCTGFSQYIQLEGTGSMVCRGYIYVEGRTNVNKFEFSSQLSSFHLLDRYPDTVQWIDPPMFEIPVPISAFKTSNPSMHRDFLELLKANRYPYINIAINYPMLKRIYMERDDTVSQFEITMAGVTNDYRISCRVVNCVDDYVHIMGSKEIKLTDFNLEPPEKFLGLVKVDDSVMINFGIVFGFHDQLKFTGLESKH